MPTGKISWFGGPSDPSAGSETASGAPTSRPGIAVYNHSTLGGFWLVRMPNGRQAVLQQTDIGPAPWTGRFGDFTYSSLSALGYSESTFPTDAAASFQYLGKNVPATLRKLVIGQGGSATATGAGTPATGASSSSSSGAYGGLGGFLLKALLTLAFLGAGLTLAGVGARNLLGKQRA